MQDFHSNQILVLLLWIGDLNASLTTAFEWKSVALKRHKAPVLTKYASVRGFAIYHPVGARGWWFKCIIDCSVSALIFSLRPYPLSGQTWINPAWNWVSHPGSRSVHMGHFHWPTAAMARGVCHTNHWLFVTMKVQTHHKERLRWTKSVESSCYFSSANMR